MGLCSRLERPPIRSLVKRQESPTFNHNQRNGIETIKLGQFADAVEDSGICDRLGQQKRQHRCGGHEPAKCRESETDRACFFADHTALSLWSTLRVVEHLVLCRERETCNDHFVCLFSVANSNLGCVALLVRSSCRKLVKPMAGFGV